MGIKHFLILLAIPVIVSANTTTRGEHNDTTHGVPAREDDFPFMVSVLLRHPQHICGGSLLDAPTILTATDCVAMAQQHGYTSSDLIVRAGSLSPWSDGWLVRIVAMITHPDFGGPLDFDKDVAILKLEGPIPESENIGYATLAAAGTDSVAGSIASAAGWRYTDDQHRSYKSLMKVDVPVVSREKCTTRYNILYNILYKPDLPRNVTKNMFCTGYQENHEVINSTDICQSDRGGPVIDSRTGILWCHVLERIELWHRGASGCECKGGESERLYR